ncbi:MULTISPECIES: cation:proton antiporter [unclassified Amycolatopsis]|uniref:cation:proton antiporter n=1 Tax=unclassified Amycolatopsis TaxID=2618356 RepID=UPI002E1A54C0|nr:MULTISPECIES: cation:proton antiporter [unclassified Amycolatopsis]
MHLAAPVAPIAPHPLLLFLLGLLVLLTLAKLLGRLAERFGLPSVVGELVTGMLLGPSLLGHLAPGFMNWLMPTQPPEQIHLLDGVGQFAVLLLVGITGTHLDTRILRRQGRTAATVSLVGLLVPLALGIGLGFVLPGSLLGSSGSSRWVFALFIGVAMCVTAIPVIAKTLTDMKLLHRNIGQLTLAAGMVDDAVGWLLLSVVSAAATVGVSAGVVSLSIGYLLGFIALAGTIGRVLVRKLMDLAAKREESGPVVAMAVIILLAFGATTQSLGMEPVFGAFVGGILIAQSRASQAKLAPLRTVVLSVLAPLFLATAGLRMDLTALAHPTTALAAAALLALAIVGKFAGAYGGARMSGLSKWEGLALGAGMNSRGVIEVIVALTGLRLGVLNTATYTMVVLVAIVTSVMAPPLLRVSMRRVARTEDEHLRMLDHEAWLGHSLSTPEPLRAAPETLRRDAA